MSSTTEPKLAPPGAGLPTIELFVARILFGMRLRLGNRDSFTAQFQREREAIRVLVRTCSEESGARRVLIRRPPGLEDSSRYWSVWMTLDHLRIVHQEIARVIGALTHGDRPPGRASTAAVKPSPDASSAIVADYEQSCDALLAIVDGASQLNTVTRFIHPWFGPLNAAGWHALAAGHMGIHRVQIERILQGLPTAAK